MPEYTNVSLKKEIADTVDKFIKMNPSLGFRSITQFIEDAIRRRLEQLGAYAPLLEHFNVNLDHVTIIDHKRRMFADVYFSRKGITCELCMSQNCEHVKYALTIPKVIKTLEKHGWKIEDGEIIKKPP